MDSKVHSRIVTALLLTRYYQNGSNSKAMTGRTFTKDE
jgi:hypothetical protein